MDNLTRYRTLSKRFNERLILAAGTINAFAVGAVGVAVLVPMVETQTFVAALTTQNGAIALWCLLIHLIAQTLLGFCMAEEPA